MFAECEKQQLAKILSDFILLSQYVVSLEKNLFVIINMLINYKVLKIIRKKIIIIILCVVSNYVLME